MLWVKHQFKKGHHGGSLRLPEYAYVVRISKANLCDIGTSCKTAYTSFGHTTFLVRLYLIVIRNIPTGIFRCRSLWETEGKEEGEGCLPSSDIANIFSLSFLVIAQLIGQIYFRENCLPHL